MRRVVIAMSVLAAAWGLCGLLAHLDLIPGGLGGPILWLLVPYTLAVIAGCAWERLPAIYHVVKEAVLASLVWVLSIRFRKAKPAHEFVEFESDDGCGAVTLMPKKTTQEFQAQIEAEKQSLLAAREQSKDAVPSASPIAPCETTAKVEEKQIPQADQPEKPAARQDNKVEPSAEISVKEILQPRLFAYPEITPTPAKRIVINGWRGQVPSELFIAPASPEHAAELIRNLDVGLSTGALLRRTGAFADDDAPHVFHARSQARFDPADLADRIVKIASHECPDRDCLAEAFKIAASRCMPVATI